MFQLKLTTRSVENLSKTLAMSFILVFKFWSDVHVPAMVPPPKLWIQPPSADDVPTRILPATVRSTVDDAVGDVVPIPTRPPLSTVNTVAPDEDATTNAGTPAVPVMPRVPAGEVLPIPRRPLEPKLNMIAPVDEAMLKMFVVVVPWIFIMEVPVDVPILILLLNESANRIGRLVVPT